jgi:hypothetical protein
VYPELCHDKKGYVIYCDLCGGKVSWFLTRKNALAAWNRRVVEEWGKYPVDSGCIAAEEDAHE